MIFQLQRLYVQFILQNIISSKTFSIMALNIMFCSQTCILVIWFLFSKISFVMNQMPLQGCRQTNFEAGIPVLGSLNLGSQIQIIWKMIEKVQYLTWNREKIDESVRNRPPKYFAASTPALIFSLFWPKNDRVPGQNNTRENQLWDFWFKTRFETFWIDSDQKNFLTLSFFHYFGHFGRKTTASEQKILHGKNFSISRFSV